MSRDATVPSGPPAPRDDAEALAALTQIGGRRTLPIPPALLARHVLSLPGAWDWPVRRAAFEAILRRLASARSQELTVLEAPEPRDRVAGGRWHLGRPDLGLLPYDVRLTSVEPPVGRCDCADFTRASLGLCKHLLVALEAVFRRGRPRPESPAAPPARSSAWRLLWDGAAPASGAWDLLAGVRLLPPSGTRSRAALPVVLRRLFSPSTSDDPEGAWRLRAAHEDAPKARLGLVTALHDHVRRSRATGDPALKAVLEEERRRLSRVLRLRAAGPRLERALSRSKRRLYPYQDEGVRRFFAQGRLVLADDMGLGKTTQAIAATSALIEAKVVGRALLVVPASLKPQWEREWREASTIPLQVVEGGQAERRAVYETKARDGVLLTSYEQVVRDFDAIAAWNPELVVLDEAQRIKNWATKTALTLKRLRPDFRLILTGTPMENRLEELASIVEWVDDRALEPKWRLVPFHSLFADGKREVVGARNLDALRSRLAPVLLRRVREEVLSQLPARQDTVVPVELEPEQRAAHDELYQPIAKLAAKATRRPLSPAEFLQLMSLLTTQRVISNGLAQLDFEEVWPGIRGRSPTPKLLESLKAPKLTELRELVGSLAVTQERKVVVFSQWRRMLELAAWAVSDVLAQAGKRALFFTGQEGPRRRTQNLVDFHDDPQAAVLFLTDAGGVGLNLQKAASACVNLELPWNPAVLEQRIGRIHRHGQRRPIDVYNLVSRGCIEERIAALVAEKRALFKGLFQGQSDELRFDRSGALLAMLEKVAPGSTPSAAVTSLEEEADDEAAGGETALGQDAAGPPGATIVQAGEARAPIGVSETAVARPLPSVDAPGDDVTRVLERVTVKRTEDGGVRLEAPPEAASALVALFSGMARMLAASPYGAFAAPDGDAPVGGPSS